MSELTEHRLQQYLQETLVEEYVTLRDFFAGCALAGTPIGDRDGAWKELARNAYGQADAMIAARKVHPND